MNRDIRDFQHSILNALCCETSSRIIISINLRSLGIRNEVLDLAWNDLGSRGKMALGSTVLGDISGVDTDGYRLPNRTGNIDDCVLCKKPVGNGILAEEGQNMVRQILGKAHGGCLYPETWPGELRFLPSALQGTAGGTITGVPFSRDSGAVPHSSCTYGNNADF
jgi:hypothetical protein